MRDPMISFLTPYWSGREMMRVHLRSFRAFFPTAPILISKKGGDREEMEDHRTTFGVRYWMEDCNYMDALLRLLSRCESDYVCITDHDTVLLGDPAPLLEGLARGRWDLVGIEERIRDHPAIDRSRLCPEYKGWMRLAPGYMDATFLMFNLRSFLRRWGLKGVQANQPCPADYEFHYGICEKLTQHKYLLPFHTQRYGIGNVLKDGDAVVLWHQWYGAYRARLRGPEADVHPGTDYLAAVVSAGEEAFLDDYPALDLSNLVPAWGPELDVIAERCVAVAALPSRASLSERLLERLRRWRGYTVRKFLAHGWRWIERRWQLR